MEYKLSILIPVIHEHKEKAQELVSKIKEQQFLYEGKINVEINQLFNGGEGTIGFYRNQLLNTAKGEYVCFIDADDEVSENYIPLILEGLQHNPTHLSLKGIITTRGENPETFEHSTKYKAWRTNNEGPIKYERNPNHLNVIRADITKQFKFPEITFGEDHSWSKLINNSGLLTDEYYIDEILYYYKYIPK